MEKVWIIGVGGFGLRAAKYLLNQHQGFQVELVDRDREKLDQAKDLDCKRIQADGIDFLNASIKPGNMSVWVVPAVPVHLAWEWCCQQFGKEPLPPEIIPFELDGLLPNAMRGTGKDLYVSHADFYCPANCSEPDDFCTVTGEPRKQDMYKLLSGLRFQNFHPLVIQSHQLGPGVGGYRLGDLCALPGKISRANGPCLLCTACRCHGVITGVPPLSPGFRINHGIKTGSLV